MIHLENENLNQMISKGNYLIDFYTEWCGPCKMIAPVLEELKDKIKIIKVDVDIHPELAMDYGIMSVPTLLYIKNGNVAMQTSGFQSKEMIEKNIEELNKN